MSAVDVKMESLSDDGDLYSDDDDPSLAYGQSGGETGRGDRGGIPSAADRRAHHNALERKRRDHIKDSFSSLRDSVPSLQGEKASRAQILKKAAEYIQFMRKKNSNVQVDIEEIKKQNKMLEEQIRLIEKQRPGGNGSLSNPYSNQSLTMLSSSESANVSSSYGDISENSNESASNDLGIINGLNHHNGRGLDSPASSVSNGATSPPTVQLPSPHSPKQQQQQAQLLINGAAGANTPSSAGVTVRSVVKNSASTIIVQNPQIKSATANGAGGGRQSPHVIHVSSTNNTNGNITATATPIIISTSSLASSSNANGSLVSNGNGSGAGSGGGANTATYVLNKAPGGHLSLPPGYRTVVVQPSTQVSGTTTPNIHIVSTIPTATYAGRTPAKRFKISTNDNNNNSTMNSTSSSSSSTGTTILTGTSSSGGANNSKTATAATSYTTNVTSVSS